MSNIQYVGVEPRRPRLPGQALRLPSAGLLGAVRVAMCGNDGNTRSQHRGSGKCADPDWAWARSRSHDSDPPLTPRSAQSGSGKLPGHTDHSGAGVSVASQHAPDPANITQTIFFFRKH